MMCRAVSRLMVSTSAASVLDFPVRGRSGARKRPERGRTTSASASGNPSPARVGGLRDDTKDELIPPSVDVMRSHESDRRLTCSNAKSAREPSRGECHAIAQERVL